MSLKSICLLLLLFPSITAALVAQQHISELDIPSVYSGILVHPNKRLYHLSAISGDTAWLNAPKDTINPFLLLSEPKLVDKNLLFDFKNSQLFGSVIYGLYTEEQTKFSIPVFTKSCRIISGKAKADISSFWNESGNNTPTLLAYKIQNQYGELLYKGKALIKTSEEAKILPVITEGPFVSLLTESSIRISFVVSKPCKAHIKINDQTYDQFNESKLNGGILYEFDVEGLKPSTKYAYSVVFDSNTETFSFITAPVDGSQQPFVFGFTSGSMANRTDISQQSLGVNESTLFNLGVEAIAHNASFIQFSGNLISGYSRSTEMAAFEYHNWKKAIEPMAHYIPFYTAMGNHETVMYSFDDGSNFGLSVDQFPFSKSSSESVFSEQFFNPENGPASEDGHPNDPHKNKDDFPPYTDQVYHYQYGNLAVVVLNTNYWMSSSAKAIRQMGGNPSGYIMDNQLVWLKNTMKQLSENETVDHVVVVCNSPIFPANGNYASGMWYGGSNYTRPYMAAEPADKGILERRDEIIDCIINDTEKVVLLLSSADVGYNLLEVEKGMPIYSEEYSTKKTKIERSITQICCSLEEKQPESTETYPWHEHVQKSSAQPSVAFITVNGKSLEVLIINPTTQVVLDAFQIN